MDGKIFAGTSDGSIYRFLSNGALDSLFGTNGVALLAPQTQLEDIKLQADGKILAAGGTNDSWPPKCIIHRLLHVSGLAVQTDEMAKETARIKVYPNPLASETTLEYELHETATVTIQLYNREGKCISRFLTRESRKAGTQRQRISLPDNLPSGQYFISVETDQHVATVPIVKI